VSTSGNTNSPDGRDHWPYCYTAMIAGAGMHVGRFYGASDQTASSPKEKPVYPNDLLATVYYSLGIDPDMVVLNHLNQPRELVKGKQIADLVVAFPIPTVVVQFNRAKNRLGRNPIRPDVFRASKRLRQHGAIGQLFRIALPVFVQCAAAAPKHWQWYPSHF